MTNAERLWAFIADYALSLIAVLVGGLVIILQSLGTVSPVFVANTTLGLVALLATTGVVERERRFAKLERLLAEQGSRLALGVGQLTTKELSINEAIRHVRTLVYSLRESLVIVAPEPRHASSGDTRRDYEEAIEHIAKQGEVSIQWITRFTGKARAERAKKLLFEFPANKVYLAEILGDGGSFPHLAFWIFDGKVVGTRVAKKEGGATARYLFISNKAVARMFRSYYDQYLSLSVQLKPTPETRAKLDKQVRGQ